MFVSKRKRRGNIFEKPTNPISSTHLLLVVVVVVVVHTNGYSYLCHRYSRPFPASHAWKGFSWNIFSFFAIAAALCSVLFSNCLFCLLLRLLLFYFFHCILLDRQTVRGMSIYFFLLTEDQLFEKSPLSFSLKNPAWLPFLLLLLLPRSLLSAVSIRFCCVIRNAKNHFFFALSLSLSLSSSQPGRQPIRQCCCHFFGSVGSDKKCITLPLVLL